VEETRWIDIKIVLYAIACWLGYWSHMVVKFPDEATSVVVALGSYGVLMSIHWFIEKRIEQEAFYISKSNKVSIS